MQRGCTVVQGAVREGVALECPDSLGEKLENAGFSVFSKTHTIVFGEQKPALGGEANAPGIHVRQGLQAVHSVSENFTPPQHQPSEGEARCSCSAGA
jgi:hypothetical protein